MTIRSVAAISAAAGSRRRRSALGASALAVLVITWSGASVEVLADTLLLQSGEEIEGTIIDATRNTVIVRRAIGGMRQMRIRDIDEVRIDLAEGEQISGQLLSWADGIYRLRSGDEVIRISDGAILSREAPVRQTAQPSREPGPSPGKRAASAAAAPPPSVAEEPAAAAAAAGESQAVVVGPSVAEEPAAAEAGGESQAVAMDASVAGEPAAAEAVGESQTVAVEASVAEEPAAAAADGKREAAVVEPSAAEGPAAAEGKGDNQTAAVEPSVAEEAAKGEGRTVAIKASVDPAASGADGLVFRIELSRPAEQTVVVIYGTLDGTAKAGTDYEPQQGVISLAPGSEGGEVRVPLLEHQPSEGDKRFELFLMADPKVAEVVDKRVIATIQGDD